MARQVTLTVFDARELLREAVRAHVSGATPSCTLAGVVEGLTQGADEMSEEDATFLAAILPPLQTLQAAWREAERRAYEAAPSEGGRCWIVVYPLPGNEAGDPTTFRGTFAECKAHIAEQDSSETPAAHFAIRLSL